MGISRPRSGIVPVIGGTGQPSPIPYTKFDFAGAPDSEYFDWIEQADAAIGMRSIDSLEYAPHALQSVWSNPANLIKHSTDLTQSAGGSATVDPDAVDGGDVLRGDGNRESQRFDVVAGQRYYFEFEIGKAPANVPVNFPFRASALTGWEGGTYLGGNLDLETGTLSNTGGGNYSVLDGDDNDNDVGADRWRVRFDGVSDITRTDASLVFNDQSFPGSGPTGTVVLFGWQCSAAYQDTIQETGSVAALDNWSKTGPAEAVLYLVYDKGRVRYAFDNTGGAADAQWDLQSSGSLIAGLPYTVGMTWYGTGQARLRVRDAVAAPLFETLPDEPTPAQTTTIPTTNGASIVEVAPGGICYGILPETCEGSELFGLETKGVARYLLRRKQGVGSQHRPQIENECANNNIAPQDFTGLVFGGNATNQKIVQRGELYGNLTQAHWDTVEAADPKGNGLSFVYFESPSGYSNVDMVGPCGSTADYAFTCYALGSGTPDMGPTDITRVPFPLDGTFQRKDVKTAANATTSFMRVGLNGAGWILIGFNQMNVGDPVAIIPIGGSARIQLEDRPVTTVEACGINPGRNSVPQASNQGAAAPSTHPDTWIVNNTNGWTWTVEAVGPGYIDYNLSAAAASGSVDLFPQQNNAVAAAQGETWLGAFDLELVSGDISALSYFNIVINERDAAQTSIGASSLQIQNLLSSGRRTFSLSRTLTEATAALISVKLQINATSGAFDFTFRIYTRESTCPSLQQTTGFVPRKLTTGTPIEFQQWIDGLTMIIEADTDTLPTEFGRWLSLGSGEGSEQNEVRILNSTGAQIEFGYGSYSGPSGGDNTGAVGPSMLGQHTQQLAWNNVDMTHWADGVEGGTALTSVNPLPTNIVNVHFGHNEQPSRPTQNCTIQSVTFIGERRTSA